MYVTSNLIIINYITQVPIYSSLIIQRMFQLINHQSSNVNSSLWITNHLMWIRMY